MWVKMEKFNQIFLMTNKKGFSLIEVVVALVILSTSVLTIYNLILSTSGSIYKLEDHYLAKEVANNRIALIHTIEKPNISSIRKGTSLMGGKEWSWEEIYTSGASEEFLQYEIRVKQYNANEYAYKINGYILND